MCASKVSIKTSQYRKFVQFNKRKTWGQAFADYLHLLVKDYPHDAVFINNLRAAPTEQEARSLVHTRLA